MKLKLKTKNDPSTNKDAMIVFVEYGGGENVDGTHIPKKKYVEKCAVGGCIDVEDIVGYAILSKYGKCFEIVQEEKKEAVVEKKTKEVDTSKVDAK